MDLGSLQQDEKLTQYWNLESLAARIFKNVPCIVYCKYTPVEPLRLNTAVNQVKNLF
jgi:hypothetical protein